jgi:hypothetical protein
MGDYQPAPEHNAHLPPMADLCSISLQKERRTAHGCAQMEMLAVGV